MKQSLKRIAVILSIVLNLGFLSAVGWVWLKDSSRPDQHNIVSQHYEFYHKLDLSVKQDSTVDSLLTVYLEEQRVLRIQLIRLERELKDIALFTNENSGRIAEVTSEIGQLRARQEMLTAQHLRRVRSVLTAVQTEQMNAMLEESFSQRNKQSQ